MERSDSLELEHEGRKKTLFFEKSLENICILKINNCIFVLKIEQHNIHYHSKRSIMSKKVNFNKGLTPRCVSKTNINNFREPVYAVLLEDGPTPTYESSSRIKYYSPETISSFYKVLPELARYYKVTIRIVEDPNPLPF